MIKRGQSYHMFQEGYIDNYARWCATYSCENRRKSASWFETEGESMDVYIACK